MTNAANLAYTINGKVSASTTRDLDKLGDSVKGVGVHLSDLAKIAGGFIVAKGLLELPGLFGKVIGGASDLNESLSKAQTVFGASFGAIDLFATNAAKSMGMTRGAALEATGTFGAFLKAMGTTTPEASKMSQSMVQLAADIGSFNNVASDDVLLALRSGLSGEAEPMRRFGVALSETAVNARLLQMGLKPVGKEFTEQQKVMGRYSLIMEQTKIQQGDFARTSDGLANAQRILSASMGNLRDRIGTALYPAMNNIVQLLINSGIPTFEKLADFAIPKVSAAVSNLNDFLYPALTNLKDMVEPLTKNADLMNGLFAALGSVGAVTGVSLLSNLAGPLLKMATASPEMLLFAAAIGAIGYAVYKLDPDLATFTGLWDKFMLGFEGGSAGGQMNIFQQAAVNLGTALHDTVIPALKEVGEGLRVFALLIMGGSIGGELSKTQQFAVAAAGAFKDFASAVASAWQSAIQPALVAVGAWLANEGSKWAATFRNDIVPAVQATADVVRRLAQLIIDNWPTIGPILQTVGQIALAQFNAMSEALRGVIHVASEVIQFLSGAFLTDWKGAFEQSAKIARDWATGLWDNDIKPAFSQLIGYAGKIYQVGVDIINGLWDGMKDTWKSVEQWISDVPDKVLGFLKGAAGFDEHSPSKKMYEVGDNAMKGLMNGFQANYGSIQNWAMSVNSLIDGMSERQRQQYFGGGDQGAFLSGLQGRAMGQPTAPEWDETYRRIMTSAKDAGEGLYNLRQNIPHFDAAANAWVGASANGVAAIGKIASSADALGTTVQRMINSTEAAWSQFAPGDPANQGGPADPNVSGVATRYWDGTKWVEYGDYAKNHPQGGSSAGIGSPGGYGGLVVGGGTGGGGGASGNFGQIGGYPGQYGRPGPNGYDPYGNYVGPNMARPAVTVIVQGSLIANRDVIAAIQEGLASGVQM